MNNPQSERLLRLPEVVLRTGLSRSSIYARIAAQEFPAPVSLGARAVGWPSSLVDSWIGERIVQGTKSV